MGWSPPALRIIRKDRTRRILGISARRAAYREYGNASRWKCRECGNKAEEWHHYMGLEYQLDVRALCKPCHRASFHPNGGCSAAQEE